MSAAKLIPLTEGSDNPRKIPQAVFIDNTEAWVEKYGGDELVTNMNELYQKYKFMEQQLTRSRESLRVKTPDIRKTLEVVRMLKDKHGKQEEMKTNFLISDNVWAKATIPNDTGKVGLWLGANVVSPYPVRNDICGLPLPESRWIDRSRTARVGPEPARQTCGLVGWLVCLCVCLADARVPVRRGERAAEQEYDDGEGEFGNGREGPVIHQGPDHDDRGDAAAARSAQRAAPRTQPEQCNTGHSMQHARHSMVGREGRSRRGDCPSRACRT